MAFDQSTRNRLNRFVGDARTLLTDEFTRQCQDEYGLDPATGDVAELSTLARLDDAKRETARLLRDTLAHYLAATPGAGAAARKEALVRIVREQAFTVLNRLCALRLAEARGLLVESVAKGYTSTGFRLYAQLAGPGLGETGDAYAAYLFSVFDEFAVDLPVLFDRFSPSGRLFPRETVLLELLAAINDPELEPLWAEDETIGWIYQYFNSKDERKAMRDASAAPRNSRELAVRNQFFTPRYVVEFLTDNTLGRIWYEMTQGRTGLKEQCRYLVRRPNEIFLAPGETAPTTEAVMPAKAGIQSPANTEAAAAAGNDLSQEELLRQPVYIPHRPLKDPREILMLDPACGSMHFGLYAFDLFERIYEEAWEMQSDGRWQAAGGKCLIDHYPTKEALLRDMPRLILERNIHGIDIDPRAVQIAGLSLWLRAQRSWHAHGLTPAQRPAITRSNIVCAEPMPGEAAFLEEFLSTALSSSPEDRLLGQIVRRAFEAMKLAGEAGSLLKIEEEIAGAVAEAKQKWQAKLEAEQAVLIDVAPVKPKQAELGLDVRGITDEAFWDLAEENIYAALRDYAERAANGNYQRRLFAEDAERGFAFIDVCRKRYDAIVMNPPFGAETALAASVIEKYWKIGEHDLATAFVVQSFARLISVGMLGVIMTRTPFFLSRFRDWRSHYLLHTTRPLALFVDLGQGVLDSAMVEATASVFASNGGNLSAFDCRALGGLEAQPTEFANERSIQFDLSLLHGVPNKPLAYYAPRTTLAKFRELGLYGQSGEVKQGLATKDNDRFVRLWWEVPAIEMQMKARWRPYAKGGEYARFFLPLALVVDWSDAAQAVYRLRSGQMVVLLTGKRDRYLHRPGITYSKRSQLGFSARVMPSETVFSPNGPGVFPNTDSMLYFDLAFLNSSFSRACLEFLTSFGSYSEGYVESLAYRKPNTEAVARVEATSKTCVEETRALLKSGEANKDFYGALLTPYTSLLILEQQLQTTRASSIERLNYLFNDIDDRIASALNLNAVDVAFAKKTAFSTELFVDEDQTSDLPQSSVTGDCLSFVPGCIFGRWDIRFATGERPAPELPDPFAPLPVCPPGMLQNAAGLPAAPADVPAGYPLRISWGGILPDDAGHHDDIERRVRDALRAIWAERADAIEQEACEILGVKTLREYFRKPGLFFADHLKRYSKSRRQAPIYWPLSTPSGSYTLWLYYHRLSDQTLYTCVNDFVEPRLKAVAEQAAGLARKSGRSAKDEEELEQLTALEAELKDFRAELLRVAAVWKPNLNDGVQITAAPLWRLFQFKPWQKKLKDTWAALEAGDYDWAHLAYSVWPARVREKCKTDKSLAIAHDLEAVYVEPPASARKKAGRKKKVETETEALLDEDEG